MPYGMFNRLARPYFTTDNPAGASPLTEQPAGTADQAATAPQEAAASDQAAPQPAATPAPEQGASNTDDQAADHSSEPDTASDELSDDDWKTIAGKRGREAAKRRTELQAARTELEAAQARIAQLAASATPEAQANARADAAERRAAIAEAAALLGVPQGVITAARELDSAPDEAARTAALEKLRTFLAPATAGTHRPPTDPATNAPSLQQQITDAEKTGNTRLAVQLKAQLLAGGGT